MTRQESRKRTIVGWLGLLAVLAFYGIWGLNR